MKSISYIFATLLIAGGLQAQTPAEPAEKGPGVKVRIKNVQVEEQQTPQLNVTNIKMKRWTAKNWIEFDVEFDIKLPPEAGGRKGSFPGMQLNIYAALQEMTKEAKPKRIVLQGSLDLLDIPADEPCHALAYISPATMKSLTMKDTVTASVDIQGWGVEMVVGGKVIAAKSSVGKSAWWEAKDNFEIMQGMVLNKMQTPFAAVFGDYDVPVKAK